MMNPRSAWITRVLLTCLLASWLPTTHASSDLFWDVGHWDQTVWAADPDTDGDGIADSVDLDDDNDGMSDVQELARGFNPLDADMDNDGVNDPADKFPTDVTKTIANDVNWVPFANGSVPNGSVDAIVRLGSDIYIAGAFTQIGSLPANRIARWDGNSWSALGAGLNGVALAMTLDGAGNLVVGGGFTTADGVSTPYIAVWDGVSWSSLGAGTNQAVRALATDTAGNVYVGGQFTLAGGIAANRIAKWDGFGWSALGSGMNSTVYALAMDAADNLYVGGSFSTASGVSANKIARWDGVTWNALGSGMAGGATPNVLTLTVASSGELYAGGQFTTAGGVTVNRVAKWQGGTWHALGSGMNLDVKAVRSSGSTVIAGGFFTNAGGNAVNYIAEWDGSAWLPLHSGATGGAVNSMAQDLAGNLIIGGNFTSVGGKSIQRIARWLLMDSDNDGYGDEVDPFPADIYNDDLDHDGLNNSIDLDDDGDGVPDYIDADPLNAGNANEMVLPLNNGQWKGSRIIDGATAMP